MKSALLIMFLASPFFSPAQNRLSQFDWLKGLWKLEAQEIFETWLPVSDTAWGAVSYHIDEDGEQIVDEIIRIVNRGNRFYFVAALQYTEKNKPTDFEIIKLGSRKFIAENKKHDFPQRIVYQLKDKKHLLAFIEGKENGQRKKLHFNFILQE